MPTDPYRAFNFCLLIDNETEAGFSECKVPKLSLTPVSYRDGNDARLHPRKYAGLTEVGNISCTRGLTSGALFEWYMQAMNGSAIESYRRDGTICLRDETGQDVFRWNFFGGFIISWDGPALNASENAIAFEKIEISIERIEMEVVPQS